VVTTHAFLIVARWVAAAYKCGGSQLRCCLCERASFFHTQVIPYEGIMMKLIKTCSSAREKDPAAAVELKKNKELSGGKSSATEWVENFLSLSRHK